MATAVTARFAFSITGAAGGRHSREEVTAPSAVQPHGTPVNGQAAAPELEAIYDEYFDFVWRSLRRLGVWPGLLEDAQQDVFLVVHRRLAEFQQRSSVKTWLFGICLRVASDYARRARSRPLGAELGELADPAAPDPLEQAARSEAVVFLDAQLGALEPDKRAVFILGELEGMSAPEIAEAVGANVHTVTSRLKAARAQFEAAVRRHQARDRRKWWSPR
jgi:RNA polymerase sigma-70 factor, ECF subfamily